MDAASDDRRARFTALWREHHGRVHAYCRRRLPPDQADDAAGETMMAAWRRLDDLPDDPLPWLYRTALGIVANRRRGARRRRALVGRLSAERPPAVPDPLADGSDPELAAALARLGPRDREALLLTYWEDLPPARAAAALGCSPRAFAMRLNRAHHRLRRALDEEAGRRPDPAAEEAR